MTFITTLKATIIAGGLALVGSTGYAATVANLDVEGTAALGFGATAENPLSGFVEAIQITGDFDAFVDLGFDPDTVGLYTLAADFSLNGTEVFNESISAVTTATDIAFGAIDIALTIESILPGLIGNVLEEAFDGTLEQTEVVAGVWLGLDFDLSDSDPSDGTLAGGFTAVLSGEKLAEPDFLLLAGPSIDFDGSANLSVDVSAVPLPASAPLLAFALGGVFFMRRRTQG